MKYTTEMGPDAKMCIQIFINTGSGIQKLIRGIHKHINTQTAW
jgi:hypothetical protein